MEKIAIIGLSCLFPGAKNTEQYWQNLLAQKNSTSRATAEQMGVDAELFFTPGKGTQDKYYCIQGGYIRDFSFDPTGYNFPADYIDSLDDLFKWPLYVSQQALQDSGYLNSPTALERCGLVFGNLSFPTKTSHHLFSPIYKQAIELPVRELLQNAPFSLAQLADTGPVAPQNLMTFGYPAAFVSQAIGLGGVNFALDAACASSLYAVKLAGQYLLTGKTDLMLAGAVSRADPFFINMGFSIFHAYPENGLSHPLNKTSNGLFAGEGAGVFVLKRHRDALRDGDKIHAVISGIGLSNDGKGKFLLQPNPKGQILAFERAYANANITPDDIDYVECHATGTPVGDKTELNSMESFFGRSQTAPRIGCVKSNLGHLLTAAGMAGMSKVILGMQHGQIPATINLTDPLSSRNGLISGEQMVKSTILWPQQGHKKRAAVNAFGFGGANAHLILEEPDNEKTPQPDPQSKIHPPKTKMAIVGMDAFFGGCNGLDCFGRTIYDGQQHFVPVPKGRWQGIENREDLLKAYGFEKGKAPHGAYITDFDMDFLHFKIPPNNDQPIPQQLLILHVADQALQDAGLKEGGNVAVIIGTGTELSLHRFRGRVDLSWQIKESLAGSGIELTPEQTAALEEITKTSIHEPAQVNQYTSFIGNIMASRISAQWDFSGPTFTLSAEENSTFKALEVAQMFLAAGEVDAVVVGAVDLAGGVENVLIRNHQAQINSGPNTLSIDQKANGWMVGEGAGVVVLKRYDDAVQADDRIYAVIDGVSIVQAAQPNSADGVATACRQALVEAGITPPDVGYLELFGSGFAAEDETEITGVTSVYRAEGSELSCAIGSVKANIGHTFAASGIAGLIKTAHCLYHRYIPATPQWSGPKMAQAWQNSPFYIAPQSKPWFLEAGTNRRVAAINGLGADNACTHVILSDDPTRQERDNPYLARSPFYLLPIAADNQELLLAQLKILQQTLESNIPAETAARQCFDNFQAQAQATYTLSIVGGTIANLLREIKLSLQAIPKTFETGDPWKTPAGSYFTPKPLGMQGNVTFVYPGAFSSYPGLGRDIFHLFPDLHHSFAAQVPNAGELVGDKALFKRSLHALSRKELKQQRAELMSNPITMLQSGATYSTLVTKILREQFKLQPDSALGYSLGEMTMMFALGIWSVRDNNSAELRSSPLFNNRLSGPKNAVREFWGMPQVQPAQSDKTDSLWAIFVLKAPADEVSRVVDTVDRVYLTHINTPQEVVIGGDPSACQQVISILNCPVLPVPYSHVIHCEPMRSEQGEFRRLNTIPLTGQPPCDLYFAAHQNSDAATSETIAQNIAIAATQRVDFPRLVQRAYNNGARIFVELGPLAACAVWIDDILKEQEHLAVSINRRSSQGDRTALVKMLAQLVSHRTPLDLSALYETPSPPSQAKRSLVRTVSLTETAIHDVILTEENRKKFNNIIIKSVAAPPQPVVQPAIVAPPVATRASSIATPPSGANRPPVVPQPLPVSQEPIDKFQQEGNETTMKEPFVETANISQSAETEDTQENSPTLSNIDTEFLEQQLAALSENSSRANKIHAEFLRSRGTAIQQMQALIEMQLIAPQSPPPAPAESSNQTTAEVDLRVISAAVQNRPNHYSTPEQVIWDQDDLLEFAEGKIAPVFGPEYAIIDTYKSRVRLPTPPYLLVSRITKLQGQRDVYEPSKMTTEYDIPFDAWYTTDGQIPWAVSVESGQCDLMLISYLGIDFQNKGERVYRLLDCTLTFLEDIPLEGYTLRYDISIDSFAKSGESLLFFFSYNCFVGDTMVLKMRGGCAGFFTEEELAGGKGIITTEKEKAQKAALQKQHFEPLLTCTKTSFDKADLMRLVRGDIAAAFGDSYNQQGLNPSLRLPQEGILMVDRLTTVDPHGGAWGLGLIVSEKDMEPDHWYFPCHFSDDQVMAGSLVAEGCSQLLQFYLLYLGFQTQTRDARFQPVKGLPQVVRTRKQITACSSKLIYRMEITEIGLLPQPYAKANVDIIFEGRVVVDFKNLGLQLTEKSSDDPWFVPKAAQANLEPAAMPTDATPPTATAQHTTLGPALFDDYHIQNFAMGSISAAFGPDYQVFEGRRIPRTPNGDLKLISRIVEINAQRLVFTGNPGLVSEYDVPVDPWFCRQNSYPTTPYSILMEIGLQPCGFLSAYLGSTLPYPQENFYFRNLDGDGEMMENIDIRGKTIVNRVSLLSSTAIQGIIIQKFSYQLEVGGEVFYKGTAVFGYFQPQSLANQVGLDQGKSITPWYRQADVPPLPAAKLNLNAPSTRQQLFHADKDKPFYHLAGNQLNFLDNALIIPDGGRHRQGYVFADKKTNPEDWFFKAHFYQDPVMPGSLGVEAILQAMQIFALKQNLGAHLKSPYFTHLPNHKVVWMYRGQITPADPLMNLEVHLSKIETSHTQVTITGDASLWKGKMRIYDVKDIAIRIDGSR